jgi:lipoprotein-anchoring transpeptidase ErfK/SrfK
MWAPVLRKVLVRAGPSAQAQAIAQLDDTTPEGTENIVLIVGRRDGGDGLWLRVRLATLPNSSTGWVPRNALGGSVPVDTHLVVDVDALVARLFRGGRIVFHAPVGVGQPAWPTPKGDFYVRNKLTTYSSPFYGPVAFGTSARSAVLTDWPAGGFIGIHGTDQPELLPGRVSHGCIRMRNSDVLRLAQLMPVGTPITIH